MRDLFGAQLLGPPEGESGVLERWARDPPVNAVVVAHPILPEAGVEGRARIWPEHTRTQ